MKLASKLMALTLIGYGVLPSFAMDQMETTTVERTTTRTAGVPIKLPTTTTYVIVDPFTGAVRGTFDPLTVLDVQTYPSGVIIVDQLTGKIVATVDESGRPVDVVTAPAFDPLITSIDNRRAELERKINSAQSDGSIDSKQTEALRNKLDKIANQESLNKQSDNKLTYGEALSLALALNNLGDQLSALINMPSISPLIGSRFVNVNEQVLLVSDDIEYRRIKLEQKTDDLYAAGRLSAQQVADLRAQLNNIAAVESKYKKDDALKVSEKEKLSAKLDNIEADLKKDIASTDNKKAKIGIKIE